MFVKLKEWYFEELIDEGLNRITKYETQLKSLKKPIGKSGDSLNKKEIEELDLFFRGSSPGIKTPAT